jgi:drug/metabolite transporter (DMT)-like permease
MIYGLFSAAGFGVADLCGAVSTRRIGVPTTLLVIQTVNLVLLSALMLTPLPGRLHASAGAWAAILASGVLGTVSFFSFYRALQLGPIAVVSPVFASYAAVAVVLSVVLIGEHLSALAAAGVATTLTGVALASARRGAEEPSEKGPARRLAGPGSGWGGIPFALIAMVAWGVASFIIGRYSQETGWFLPVYGSRLVEFAGVAFVFLLVRRRRPTPRPSGASAIIPTVSGAADAVAVSLFARGSQLGLVSIMSAVSATFPLVVIAGGVVMFRERPSPVQWAGVLCTISGLVLLGVGR